MTPPHYSTGKLLKIIKVLNLKDSHLLVGIKARSFKPYTEMSKTKLTAKWQLDAALLSRPVDLTALVSMSRNNPESFAEGDNTLNRLVSSLLNEKNAKKSDKDTKLDVLNILANVAKGSKHARAEVTNAVQGVSEWFDQYMASEEGSDPTQEPELHKAMVLLLARCYDYNLRTDDVLELTQGNRRIALCTVVGLLEDGETYSTELKQRQKPGQGKMAQVLLHYTEPCIHHYYQHCAVNTENVSLSLFKCIFKSRNDIFLFLFLFLNIQYLKFNIQYSIFNYRSTLNG